MLRAHPMFAIFPRRAISFFFIFFASLVSAEPNPQPSSSAPIIDSPSAREVGRQELKTIPKKPSAPLPPGRPGVNEYFNCDRYFVYEGKRIVCDSYMRKDAEKLRPILEEVPEAVAELNAYQDNRRTLRNCAYIGSIGVLSFIIGNVLRDKVFVKDGFTHQFLTYGGLGVAGTSLIYGFAVTQRNEAHIGNAVQYYNNARPDRPIQILFNTDFDL